MIHLRFEGETRDRDAVLGPAPCFRVSGNVIRQGPEQEIVGVFQSGCWQVRARRFLRYFCEEPCMVSFEDRTGIEGPRIGPCSRIWVEDGMLHTDDILKAKFHERTQVWQVFESATYWPVMVLRCL